MPTAQLPPLKDLGTIENISLVLPSVLTKDQYTTCCCAGLPEIELQFREAQRRTSLNRLRNSV
jgi:hypothetical protein